MAKTSVSPGRIAAAALCLAALGLSSATAWAHCDSKSGPVAVAAREALEKGQFEPVAIWVGEEQADELKSTFEQCLPVYKQGGAAAEVAERLMTETAVRLHREAEGIGYTGLKPAQALPPDIAAAEKALETGDLEPVTDMLADEMRERVRQHFEHAREARKHKDESVQAGREWVDAYVKYVIYVNGLHQTIAAGPAHGVGD